jgi:hypothetical protein
MRTFFLASFWWIVSSALALLALVVGYLAGLDRGRREGPLAPRQDERRNPS